MGYNLCMIEIYPGLLPYVHKCSAMTDISVSVVLFFHRLPRAALCAFSCFHRALDAFQWLLRQTKSHQSGSALKHNAKQFFCSCSYSVFTNKSPETNGMSLFWCSAVQFQRKRLMFVGGERPKCDRSLESQAHCDTVHA